MNWKYMYRLLKKEMKDTPFLGEFVINLLIRCLDWKLEKDIILKLREIRDNTQILNNTKITNEDDEIKNLEREIDLLKKPNF